MQDKSILFCTFLAVIGNALSLLSVHLSRSMAPKVERLQINHIFSRSTRFPLVFTSKQTK